MLSRIFKKIVSVSSAVVMLMSSSLPYTKAFAEDNSLPETSCAVTEVSQAEETASSLTEEVSVPAEESSAADISLEQQNIELRPNGDGEQEKITLEGFMPQGASAAAEDVTEEFSPADVTPTGEEDTGKSVVAAYDISILDGNNEYQPDEEHPILVEICDPSIKAGSSPELWHIKDSGERERITDITVEDGKISFYAKGFSVYVIVDAPEVSSDTSSLMIADSFDKINELGSSGFYLSNSAGYYLTQDVVNNVSNQSGRDGIMGTSDADTTGIHSAAKLYYFTQEDGEHKYSIYTKIGETLYYVKMTSCNKDRAGLTLTAEEAQKTIFTLEESSDGYYCSAKVGAYTYYWNRNTKNPGIGAFVGYSAKSDANVVKLQLHYEESSSIPNDPNKLNGKTHGLFHYTEGATMGNALMAEGASHSLVKLVITANGSNKTYYVDEDNEVSQWTFTYDTDGKYLLSANTSSGKVYLCAGASGISMTSNAADAGRFKIDTNNTNHTIRLSSNGVYVTYDAENKDFGVTTNSSDSGAWLYLLDPKVLDPEKDYITFSADRVSVCDIKDGQKVILYIRIWNEDDLRYDMYAIDHRGELKPCYASGGKIMWLGDGTGTLEWTFTEYLDAVTKQPNYYYELFNSYSEKYLAPQLENSQVLADEPIGINLQGRRNGEFYSSIIAWDDSCKKYIGLRPNATKTALEPCSQSAAFPIYFATLEELNLTDRLHEVPTLDNNDYGIKMKMIDFGMSPGYSYGNSSGATVTNEYFGGKSNSVDQLATGLLSTDLKADGYPVVTANGSANPNASLKDVFSGATTVNHLFLEREYNSSGYFEFDSCQNFATLKKLNTDGTVEKGADGKELYNTNGDETNFTVFHELGTHDSTKKASLQHGQFFPYDTIKPGTYAASNETNMYTSLKAGLSDDDPRKYEKLHLIQNEDKKAADYYFGMELEASFVQTPSGLDAWGHDIVFEFTGDDDFWLYVDDELVLDLGGTHAALMGKVNFRTGEVTYNNAYVNSTGKVETTTTTLREIFDNNMKARGVSDADRAAKLNEMFEKNSNGQYIFKDYTNHTMRVFYMERGAGASNLYMHFNLASVTPGNVVLSKDIEGSGKDLIDTDFVEYPFQIYYKEQLEDGTLSEEKLLKNDNEHIRVTYQNSNLPVTFVQKYRPPGVSDDDAYENVYFINPSKKAEISFPDNTMQYRLVECAVDSSIYEKVLINGEEVPAERVEHNHSNATLVSYSSLLDQAEKAPIISFTNFVNSEVIKDLYITKILRDDDGNIITDDDSEFSFRLYLSTVDVPTADLPLANMVNYYVLKDGYLCKYDKTLKKYVSAGVLYSRDNIDKIKNNEIAGLEIDDVVTQTSGFGAISGIPAGYTICVPNLPAGTVFKLTEDIKPGYGLDEYKCVMGEEILEDGSVQELPSYNKYEGNPDNVGKVIKEFDPRVKVYNKKGFSLTVDKKWSDLDLTTAHEPIYVAVYAEGDLVEGSVKQIKSPSIQAYYFWSNLVPNPDGTTRTSLNGYVVKEVKIGNADPTVAEDGTVTNYGTVTPLESGSEQTLGATRTAAATPDGESRDKEYDYVVSYNRGKDTGASRVDTVTNTRDGGIAVKLFKWKSYEPLGNGIFTLEDSDGKLLGTYTSDSEGTVTLLYSFERNKMYTLTQTVAPKGYIGLREPLSFKVNDDDTVSLFYSDGTEWGTHTGVNCVYDKYYAGSRPGEGGITAFVDVFNKPFNFKIEKTDSSDPSKKLSSAHFELHKQRKATISGYIMNDDPMSGFEDMVTVNGVVDVCGGNSGRYIDPGPNGSVYFLIEREAPFNYTKLKDSIIFSISPLGIPEIKSDSYNGTLYENDDSYVYTLSVPNTQEDAAMKLLTIDKRVNGAFGSRSEEFDFTVSISGAGSSEGFVWAKNGEKQTEKMPSTGGTFTMKHGDRIEINLPANVNVTVVEDNGDYTTRFKLGNDEPKDGSSITFKFTDSCELLVTNTLNGIMPMGTENNDNVTAAVIVSLMMLSVLLLVSRRSDNEQTGE